VRPYAIVGNVRALMLCLKGDSKVEILRKSSEAEMISEFLRAEYSSVRFSEQLVVTMGRLGITETIITEANLKDESENVQRKKLLGDFRGYGEDRELFEHFPMVSEWTLCRFSGTDLEHIRYIDYSYWNELSAGTGCPLSAAETVRKGIEIFGVSNEGFIRAAEYIKGGGRLPKLFFLTTDYENYVIVEGHQRVTAYALVPEYFCNVEVIVGRCKKEALEKWM